ncbi:unnamed protein product [Cuscuta epithymum]|uniref:General transcription factor 3C polypeptide 5 n=1 Tax=Cuscuta epithymum TaxID=186058 RepID=A0AAV0EE19_9ASTE|nr:unnamed protein product [Cuscuta epithymum]
MGIIIDGSISGNLPSNDNTFIVHYPAYPSSLQRAVETLGGTEAIAKARTSKTNTLELRFRPEDPYSHPTIGKHKSSLNFLLKITKEKILAVKNTETNYRLSKTSSLDMTSIDQNKSHPESSEASKHANQTETVSADACKDVSERKEEALKEQLSADVVALVADAYHFDGMADYQHVIAVHADVARRKKRNWAELEMNFEKSNLIDADQEDLMILVPQLFSMKDMPDNIMLKPCGTLSSKKKQEGVVQQSWEMEIEPCLAIDFNNKDIPKKVNWEKYISKGTDEWELQTAVSKFFDERPVWAKEALAERLLQKGMNLRESMLKRLLFREAYYFSQGPFRRLWIRKGYDPRTDPESRIYQSIDFRVHDPLLRSYCEAQTESGVKHRWTDVCSFQVFPSKCQISLQLCDLVDDYIQEEIKKPHKTTECSCQTGWFPSNVLECLRLRVSIRFVSVYPNPGVEQLLKKLSARFERSKRTPSHVIRDEEKEQEDVDQDMENNEGNEDADGDEGEVEEDSKHEFEVHDMVEPEGNISSQHGLYNDSISRTYLQELFGNFPCTDGMPEVQDDQTDGEYQIYDQFGDEDYSEADDY